MKLNESQKNALLEILNEVVNADEQKNTILTLEHYVEWLIAMRDQLTTKQVVILFGNLIHHSDEDISDPKGDSDWISIRWHVDDVLDVCPHLTIEQAREVLLISQHKHDANIGINWDFIRDTADIYFPQIGDEITRAL